MLYNKAEVGIRAYPMLSSPTITVTKKVLKMAPFGMLYGRRCRTPIFWNETGERQVFGPHIIQDTEKQVHIVRENLKVAQDIPTIGGEI